VTADGSAPAGRASPGWCTFEAASHQIIMAGQLVAFTPKKVGRSVDAGKSCATVESGKWVGPAKSAAGGEVVQVNDALVNKPSLDNADPYDTGWMVILKPNDWGAVKSRLTPGTEVAPKYEAKMDADGFAGCACAP
jgi:glycine cleavage system H protein